MFHFYTPWKRQMVFWLFSVGIEMGNWAKMGNILRKSEALIVFKILDFPTSLYSKKIFFFLELIFLLHHQLLFSKKEAVIPNANSLLLIWAWLYNTYFKDQFWTHIETTYLTLISYYISYCRKFSVIL